MIRQHICHAVNDSKSKLSVDLIREHQFIYIDVVSLFHHTHTHTERNRSSFVRYEQNMREIRANSLKWNACFVRLAQFSKIRLMQMNMKWIFAIVIIQPIHTFRISIFRMQILCCRRDSSSTSNIMSTRHLIVCVDIYVFVNRISFKLR